MKGKAYEVWGETVNGRSLGIGVVVTSLIGLGVYGGVLKLYALLEFTEQTRMAAALGLALLGILSVSFIVNKFLGTRREVHEDVPSSSDLRGVLAGFDTDAAEELELLRSGPTDVLGIANDAGICSQLEQIASADRILSEPERKD